MSIETELQNSQEVDMENVGQLARDALASFEKVNEYDKNDFSTTAISDFKAWLRGKEGTPDGEIIKDALIEARIWSDDKNLVEENNKIIGAIDRFIENPSTFEKNEPGNLEVIMRLCEAIGNRY